MSSMEIEAALRLAFGECLAAGCPLDPTQQQILLHVLLEKLVAPTPLQASPASRNPSDDPEASPMAPPNPLDDLTPVQRRTLFRYIEEQNRQNRSWKAQLLNDWLQGQDSGAIQFIRTQYGLTWLEQIQPTHIAAYAEEAAMTLSVGDRIEVSNGLWEWVQEDGPCSREWIPCTVIGLKQDSIPTHASCTVRFENGLEYEIQGIYEWNRYNWRWREG
ncbi:hypothetical protein [Leptolyngbya ohadii]|uniref:hypothetical protein n=1 Tax=Leptolyngbya ohadii TaxID=1962290 RepID=UPI000B598571|nr:hypothetical protein [Leptolyngbya ohadii]